MAAAPAVFHPPPWMRTVLGPFATRPTLTTAFAVGLIVAAALTLIPNSLRPSTRAILAWDAGVVWFVGSLTRLMAGSDGRLLRARAAAQDEGAHIILAVVLVAAAASLLAIGVELSLAKAVHGAEKGLHVGMAFLTVALSWFLVQLIFALHYAHTYFGFQDDEDGIVGGLKFPGDEEPDYWDFIHFAVVIGVASQTADISFTSRPMRQIGTVHSVIAFTFNTIVLALTINLVAGLF